MKGWRMSPPMHIKCLCEDNCSSVNLCMAAHDSAHSVDAGNHSVSNSFWQISKEMDIL